MIGITSFGAYVPYNRLDRKQIRQAFGKPVPAGEKAVANYDEDSITMGVAAALECCREFDAQSIDAVFFATTTSPYREKQCATTVSAVLDLRRNIRTADFCDSLRAGSAALLAALDAAQKGQNALVAVSDCRLGAPDGPFELHFGDGAAAFACGSENVVAEMMGSYSVSVDFHDLWRGAGDQFVRDWEDRFSYTQAYEPFVVEAVQGVLAQNGLKPADIARFICYSPTPRQQEAVARKLGFLPPQVQDSLYYTIGNCGAASAPMMLVAALEEARPGDILLLVAYGEGCDAFVFRVTPEIGQRARGKGIKSYLLNKRVDINYEKYLRWKQLIQVEPAKRPKPVRSSLPDLYRKYDKNYALYGSKCTVCGTPQFPPSRVCIHCQAVDSWEKYRFYGRQARIRTFTIDYLSLSEDPPNIVAVVDFAGGGRMLTYLVDCDPGKVEVGMEVEMSYRKLFCVDGITTYFWKSVPKYPAREGV